MAGCCCSSSSCKDNELCDYTLNHDNPDLFDRSQVSHTLTDYIFSAKIKADLTQTRSHTLVLFQWCPEGRVSFWYVIYRVCMALLFVGCVAAHAITGGNGVKWLTYMTDLGVMFLTLHYVIDATLSVCRWTWEHFNPNETCKESLSSI